jgi:hypothetical protein
MTINNITTLEEFAKLIRELAPPGTTVNITVQNLYLFSGCTIENISAAVTPSQDCEEDPSSLSPS